jgi:hypothetical protein
LGGFSAGFIDSIAGGGGLISLPTLLALGLPPQYALGSNKVIALGTGIASTLRYGLSRTYSVRLVAKLLAGVWVASMLGAWTATKIDPRVLRPMIVICLILVGVYVALKHRFGLLERPARLKHLAWMILFTSLVGFYDGFIGPGTGTFLMMGFVLLFGQKLLTASANSRVINFATTLGSFVLFASNGYVLFSFVLPGAFAAFLGGLCGAHFSVRVGSAFIRPVFIVVVWLLIAKLVWDLM